MSDHYFTAAPASPDARATLRVSLAGRSVEVVTAPGIFSPRSLDKGTRVLLEEVPAPPAAGDFLDLGCGWGPIALTLGLLCPEATVWAVDVNERALDLARVNAGALGLAHVHASPPGGIPTDLSFDLIWSNPPIRVGKAVVHDLLTTWLPRLGPGGEAYLVASKNLGADSLQAWLGDNLPASSYAVSRHATSGGFRVLHVERKG
ncbi:MAG: methyltransferase [Nostocoides sp.]